MHISHPSVATCQTTANHAIAVKSGVKAGIITFNHNAITVKSGVKARIITVNHNAIAV